MESAEYETMFYRADTKPDVGTSGASEPALEEIEFCSVIGSFYGIAKGGGQSWTLDIRR
jgi:hypothetical protein